MSIIEYAERRLADPSNEDHDMRYWVAYLNGARAQLRECEHGAQIAQRTKEDLARQRDAAIHDLEMIMVFGGRNIDTCNLCATKDCYARGGNKLCDPYYRGRNETGDNGE